MLQQTREWPGSLPADRLQMSERTVRRDVERLRELGYRIDGTNGPRRWLPARRGIYVAGRGDRPGGAADGLRDAGGAVGTSVRGSRVR
ncbi:helix-turn-helix domain-containing protein [Gordonia sp. GONU]|uniref:helix-turn-helix domain-containing protein n=1 Tax=Gordonia sp. GONU TaxID=2972949 RepID=UPI0035C8734E